MKNVHVRISTATPTTTGVKNGLDVAVSVEHEGWLAAGTVTLAPSASSPALFVPGGNSPDFWVSSNFLAGLDEHFLGDLPRVLGMIAAEASSACEAFASPSKAPDDEGPRCPEWLAEIMAELGARHDLKTVEGNARAAEDAGRFSDDYGYRCRACASLARGYGAQKRAIEARDLDEDIEALELEQAGRHFAEAIDLARRAEELMA